MLESAWLFIGAVAVLVTAAAVLTTDDGVAIMAGVVGFILWGMWTWGSLDVRVVGDSVTYSFTMPGVTFVGIMLALIPGFIALTGPIDIAKRARTPEADDI